MYLIFETLAFENPEVVFTALGVLVFFVSFDILMRFNAFEKGTAAMTAGVLGVLTFWSFYTERVAVDQKFLIFLLLIAVAVIVFKIFWAMVRTAHKQF